uniref:Uncharacterized protein n=1 Tax=Arundo donax TaxID=35708 RepID=A0A0A8ZZ38_ARUDO
MVYIKNILVRCHGSASSHMPSMLISVKCINEGVL